MDIDGVFGEHWLPMHEPESVFSLNERTIWMLRGELIKSDRRFAENRDAAGTGMHYIPQSNTNNKEGVMAEIRWLNDMDTALARAKSGGKPILLDFFNPG